MKELYYYVTNVEEQKTATKESFYKIEVSIRYKLDGKEIKNNQRGLFFIWDNRVPQLYIGDKIEGEFIL